MLSNKDLYDEIETIQKAIDESETLSDLEKMLLKTQLLGLKLTHNLRTNTVAVMKHLNIDLVKSRRVLDADDSQEES